VEPRDSVIVDLAAKHPRPRVVDRRAGLRQALALRRRQDLAQSIERDRGRAIAQIHEKRMPRFGPEQPGAEARMLGARKCAQHAGIGGERGRRHEAVERLRGSLVGKAQPDAKATRTEAETARIQRMEISSGSGRRS